MNAFESKDLLEVYRTQVERGKIKWDDEQVRCAMRLRHFFNDVKEYSPPLELLARLPDFPLSTRHRWTGPSIDTTELGVMGEKEKALVRVLSGEEELEALQTPKGVLLTGPPGTGKSFLLSLLFDILPTSHKRRWHYHAFTLWLYSQVFVEMQRRKHGITLSIQNQRMDVAARKGWKAIFAGGKYDDSGRSREIDEETIPFASDIQLSDDSFDELQLLDASSAALLRDVLSWYWRLGGIVISCSNRLPEDLYHHGVQKERMAGFLGALKSRCDVLEVDGGRDWRTQSDQNGTFCPSWYLSSDQGFDHAWSSEGGVNDQACRFTFTELCERPLGPADYITLASRFRIFFIDEVPVLPLKMKNEARRFINLIDALYESRCQIHIRASSPVHSLFFPDALSTPEDTDSLTAESLSETLQAPTRPNVSIYNTLSNRQREALVKEAEDRSSSFSVLSIFTGEDERFAYKRAVSRLIEMTQSPNYQQEDWIPLSSEVRSWEISSNPTKYTRLSDNNLSEGVTVDDDFAHEASLSGQNMRDDGKAPVIREQHIWGVADGWGTKAGQWGKGTSAYLKDPNIKSKSK
ncbi:hypothetical protein TREMEDRAFT_67817 [Tremella mesenterica DSM 1558]|uniref:uncharacterized protein n=1 Tax=Tremella mesenterica (strain ATCC 24925 / CBS 8224 / DSM 1558 / NBRC 9311 / NRRL Y-6157 / RJB 2259-6 / UBC 559-6) TaxID=578456 RepID=UPI0003F490D9|nr:uncharacterized protein TREMEDRAFT_67817 [Tremella mesenterica DSM 1558]EIW71533.1 hypothetical protein TREMEDRAFT_67817 [Tremella mesenterica DSM 1558]